MHSPVIPALALVALVAASFAGEPREEPGSSNRAGAGRSAGRYADVNGLKMYYEVHGTGRPLVTLHGAFGQAMVLPVLAKDRQLIAVELQGHGHTADVDRPLSPEQMADDVATLLGHLNIPRADVFGYSMGGEVGLALAIRHPELVRRLAINGANAGRLKETFEPASFEQFRNLPADFAPPILKEPYERTNPDPKHWPVLVAKVKQMGLDFKGFGRADLQKIKAPTLIALGDRDGVRPEHAVEMFRSIPNAQLAIFPGGDHFMIFQTPERLLPPVVAFFDAPDGKPQ